MTRRKFFIPKNEVVRDYRDSMDLLPLGDYSEVIEDEDSITKE